MYESHCRYVFFFFFFQAEDGIRDKLVTGVQTCALPISRAGHHAHRGKMELVARREGAEARAGSRRLDEQVDAPSLRRRVDVRDECGSRSYLRPAPQIHSASPPLGVYLVVSASSRSSFSPHRSQCHAATRCPVLGSLSGLYWSHSWRSPRSRPSASSLSRSALTRCTIGSPRKRWR